MKIKTSIIYKKMGKYGYSQAKLAEKINISRQSVCNLLKTGSCRPDTAYRIAEAINVTFEELLLK